MTLIFTTTRQAATINGVKVLVHGRAGSGKTPLATTAPNPVILSAESGLLSVRNTDFPVILIRSIKDLDDAYYFLTSSPQGRQFWTICLDSISEIAEVCLSEEKSKNKDPRRAYGEMQDQILIQLRKYRDIDRHIYFSAKTGWVKDEVTGSMLWGPKMPGQQLGPALPYLFDEIFSLEVATTPEGRVWNYLRTQRHPHYESRDRSGALDPFEEPNLTKIFDKIMRAAA